MLSVVVPTRNERENVKELIQRIRAAVPGSEVIFADESDDGTDLEVERLAGGGENVRLIRCDGKGLAGSVLEGFAAASGDVLAVMDGDLQHPPEALREMLREVESGADIVVASRYAEGGSDGLSFLRRAVSKAAGAVARALLHRVRSCSDPTAGFFMLRRTVVDGVELAGTGWKILVEILARGRWERYAEVPIRFGERKSGKSKLSWRVGAAYARQVARLVLFDREDRRLWAFLAVGLSGVAVNLTVFSLLRWVGASVAQAAAAAAFTAVGWNFSWNDKVTFSGAPGVPAWRFVRYAIVASAGIAVAAEVAGLLSDVGLPGLVDDLAGIGASVVWNWIGSSRWAWGQEEAGKASRFALRK